MAISSLSSARSMLLSNPSFPSSTVFFSKLLIVGLLIFRLCSSKLLFLTGDSASSNMLTFNGFLEKISSNSSSVPPQAPPLIGVLLPHAPALIGVLLPHASEFRGVLRPVCWTSSMPNLNASMLTFFSYRGLVKRLFGRLAATAEVAAPASGGTSDSSSIKTGSETIRSFWF